MNELEKAIARLRELGATPAEIRAYVTENASKLAKRSPGAPTAFDGPAHGAGRSFGEDPKSTFTKVNDAARVVNQGMTFGLADEIGAAGDAVIDMARGEKFGDAYKRNVEHERSELSRYREENPKTALALELAGGLATAKIPGISKLGLMKGGAAYGAAYGAGNAEGGVGERAAGATMGAVTGAGVGGMMHGAGAVGRMAYDVARPVVEPALRAVGRFAEAHPVGFSTHDVGKQPPNATRGRTAPSVRDPDGPLSIELVGPGAPEDRANSLILDRLKSDKTSIDDLERAATEAGDKPVSLVDLAGDNTMGIARGARAVPGRAKQEIPEALHRRAEGQGARVRADLEEAAGTTAGDVVAKEEELVARRRAKAQPLYDKAYAAPEIEDPEILATLKLPQFNQAYRRAVRIAKAEGTELPPLTKKSNLGGVEIEEIVPQPVRTLDYIKRGMDDLIDSKMRSGSMGRTEARALRIRLEGMLKRVDELVPDYKAARQEFASDSRGLDALEMGKEFLKTDGRAIARTLADMTPGDRGLYAQGALEDLTQAVRGTADGRNVLAGIWKNDLKREQLRALVGDDAFGALSKSFGLEERMVRTKNFVLGGSNTADKQAEQLDLDRAGIPQAVLAFIRGAWQQGSSALANSTLLARLQGITEETASTLAPKLIAGMNGDRKALADVLLQLRKAEQREARRQAVRRSASRPFTGAAGAAASRSTGDRR